MTRTPRLVLVAVIPVLLAGCSINVYEEGSGAGGGGGGGGGGTEGAVNQEANTGQVSISGANVSPEEDAIDAVIEEYVTGTSDFTATYTGSSEFEQNVVIQIEGGTPPDVANFPQPGAVIEQAEQGHVVALEDMGFDIGELEDRFGEYLMSLGEYEGKHYGIPTDVSFKSAVWYNLPAFEDGGYTVPETWEDLIALSDQIMADGTTPWCIGTENDQATGWPATDWMEDIVLRSQGTDAYDRWATGELDFASPEIVAAGELFGEVLFTEGYVFGGHENITGTAFQDAPDPMFASPPNCLLHRQATFITNFFPEDQDLQAGEDYDFFPFPTVDGNDGVLMAGGMAAVFRNAPEVREYLEKYTSQEAQCALGSFEDISLISPNIDVGSDCYESELIAQAAGTLTEALANDVARFDASDLMPPEANSAFWNAMNAYTDNGPDNLEQVMADVDAAWPEDGGGGATASESPS